MEKWSGELERIGEAHMNHMMILCCTNHNRLRPITTGYVQSQQVRFTQRKNEVRLKTGRGAPHLQPKHRTPQRTPSTLGKQVCP